MDERQTSHLNNWSPQPNDSAKHDVTSYTSADQGDPNKKFVRELKKLLKALTRELCGEVESGSQEFLEIELKGYKEFLMRFKDKAEVLRSLQPCQERSHLLMSLQTDLIKLIVEKQQELKETDLSAH